MGCFEFLKNRASMRFIKFMKSLWTDYTKVLRGFVAALLVILTLFIILNIFGYKVDIVNSIKNKILANFLVIDSPPRVRLFTYYGTEFGLPTTSKIEFIEDKQVLTSKRSQRIYVGVYNDEGRSLKNVSFIIKLPKNAEVTNKEEIINQWFDMDTQFSYFYPRNILPRSGQMLHPPIELKFLNKVNEIEYQILCEDFLPKKGNFILNVKE